MKKLSFLTTLLLIFATGACGFQQSAKEKTVEISKEELKNKIKGGWAAQTIGVTFGGPTEFDYNGTYIKDYQPLTWYDGFMKDTYEYFPGLYDDIYMDLTFVKVIEEEGIDAPAKAFADAFANADYTLWHANQSARYNILNGIDPPESGHWLNNPHADDIDYQIEADYAGLMTPGMPNAASEISDKVGHIMNYGDGWYGGVFVGAMYSLAFTSQDVPYVVNQALRTIPKQSDFYKTIKDVIEAHKEDPDDWKQTWFDINREWGDDKGGPDGVFSPFNIDAKINAAWVVLGLLYGDGDFGKTMQIATRAGDDSDCNPATAAGILGTMYGYDSIPDYWKQGLGEVEPIDFKYTTISLNDVYDLSYEHALMMIERNNGTVYENSVSIQTQVPEAVRFEVSFTGHYPIQKRSIGEVPSWGGGIELEDEYSFEFEGIGFVVMGSASEWDYRSDGHVFEVEVYIDGDLEETVSLPTNYLKRRNEIAWKYQLPKGKHEVQLKLINPHDKYQVELSNIIIYSDEPAQTYGSK